MANFIAVTDGSKEYLLNIDTVEMISPYEAPGDAADGDVNGILIKHVGQETEAFYPGLDYEKIKKQLLRG